LFNIYTDMKWNCFYVEWEFRQLHFSRVSESHLSDTLTIYFEFSFVLEPNWWCYSQASFIVIISNDIYQSRNWIETPCNDISIPFSNTISLIMEHSVCWWIIYKLLIWLSVNEHLVLSEWSFSTDYQGQKLSLSLGQPSSSLHSLRRRVFNLTFSKSIQSVCRKSKVCRSINWNHFNDICVNGSICWMGNGGRLF
jgi:hypothetical protein